MRTFFALTLPVCSAAALLALGGLGLSDASADAPGSTPPTATLAKGTIVQMRLETSLRSGQCKAGDSVAFTVAKDVYGPGGVRLLAKGAMGFGHVTDSAGHHSFGRAGRLAFTCDSVSTGTLRVPLTLSVHPKPPGDAAPPAPANAAPPLPDLHSPSPVTYDALGNTPVGITGQVTHSGTTPPYTIGSGPDATADAGEEFAASVAADTPVPVLPPAPPTPVVPPPGAIKIDTKTLDILLPAGPNSAFIRSLIADRLQAGDTVWKMPDGKIVITAPPGSLKAPITLSIAPR